MKKHLVLAAMESEFAELVVQEGFTSRELKNASITLWEKSNRQNSIALAKTGVGPINAAITLTQILADSAYDDILMLGLGGGLDIELAVGDIVIAERVVQHDALCTFEDRTEIMACGELHLSLSPENRKSIFMPTSLELNKKFETQLRQKSFRVFRGDLLSGSEFVGSLARKNLLKTRIPSAKMVDMEACSIAYICQKQGLPFAIVKTVADTVQAQATDQYTDFLKSNSLKCAELVSYLEEF
uniref:5'-methylthioadenosine/S-adenosylhomocysteine nucleosidase n=1 Tax=Bdellovibrio bacteriovorus TaxID=959 RepID=UPI0035A5FE40